MTCSRNSQTFERLVRKVDPESRLIRAWGLTSGVSAQVTAIEGHRWFVNQAFERGMMSS